MRMLEVGCGTGQNLNTFLREGFRVFAVDIDLDAVLTARSLVPELKSGFGPFFAVADAGRLPFREGNFDKLICIDLLHWAGDEKEFATWFRELWQTLGPEGILCARFRCRDKGPARFPEAQTGEKAGWFLAEPRWVERLVRELKGEWLEPWKETPLKGGGMQGSMSVRRKS